MAEDELELEYFDIVCVLSAIAQASKAVFEWESPEIKQVSDIPARIASGHYALECWITLPNRRTPIFQIFKLIDHKAKGIHLKRNCFISIGISLASVEHCMV